jgi:hypothetical protein
MTKPATLLLLLVGCTSSPSMDIASGALAGDVAGKTWTFQAGHTDAFLSTGDDNFFAELYPAAYTPCTTSQPPSGPHLIVAVPKVAGDYPMSLMRNMTFVDGNDNKVAIDGRVVVDSVTATKVTGGLVGTFDSDNEVSGHFELTICKE